LNGVNLSARKQKFRADNFFVAFNAVFMYNDIKENKSRQKSKYICVNKDDMDSFPSDSLTLSDYNLTF